MRGLERERVNLYNGIKNDVHLAQRDPVVQVVLALLLDPGQKVTKDHHQLVLLFSDNNKKQHCVAIACWYKNRARII